MIRDLVRIRCCSVFSGVELQRTNCQYRLPDALCARNTDLWLPESNYNGQTANVGFQHSLRQGDDSSAICRLLAFLENQTDLDSSLLSLFCRLA